MRPYIICHMVASIDGRTNCSIIKKSARRILHLLLKNRIAVGKKHMYKNWKMM